MGAVVTNLASCPRRRLDRRGRHDGRRCDRAASDQGRNIAALMAQSADRRRVAEGRLGQSRRPRGHGANRNRRSPGGRGWRRGEKGLAVARPLGRGAGQRGRRRRYRGRGLSARTRQGPAGARLRHRRRSRPVYGRHRPPARCELRPDRLLGGRDPAFAQPELREVHLFPAPGRHPGAVAGRWVGGVAMTIPVTMPAARDVQLHPLSRRLMHWINALAILVMIGSGWRIYDYYPALSLNYAFPYYLTLGGEMTVDEAMNNEDGLANALLWHFGAMWVLVINLLLYLIVGIVTGQPARRHARFFRRVALSARSSAGPL